MLFPFHDDHPTVRFPVVTVALIAINAVVFLATLGLPEEKREALYVEYGFVPDRVRQLTDPNLSITVPLEPEVSERRLIVGDKVFVQRVQQPRTYEIPPGPGRAALATITCMFLHGGFMHLIGNMWFLWLFGNNVEDRLGPGLYLVFYSVGGLLALVCHWWVLTPAEMLRPVIGASGAVSAVLGGYAVMYPRARVRSLLFLFYFVTIVELPALVVLGIWFLGQLFDGLSQRALGVGGGVAFWAHIGGFAAGALLMPIFAKLVPPPAPPYPPRVVKTEPW
ncbi:MAG: rhomboid family intramembrane serine protease [Pirellulales bacterium]